MKDFVRGILRHPLAAESPQIVFAPEANSANEHEHARAWVESVARNTITIRSGRDGQISGLVTTDDTKNAQVNSMREYLGLDAVHYDPALVCTNPFLPSDKRLPMTREKFERQLVNFRIIPRTDAKGKTTFFYSGKIDSEGRPNAGLHDDMVMSFIIAAYTAKRVRQGTTNVPLPLVS